MNESGAITLEWVGGSNQVIDYNIYRDGQLYDSSNNASYIDNNAEHDVEYCYIVSANYPSGESQPTNESCTMWILAPPLSITADDIDQVVDALKIVLKPLDKISTEESTE